MQKDEYRRMFEVEDTHFWYQGMKKITYTLIRKFSSQHRNNIILDAGCGTGATMQNLDSLGEVYGFDISPVAIKYCKKRGLRNVKVGTVETIPYATSSFDIVVSLDVIYHKKVIDDAKAVQEFYRVLKPDGILILRVPAYNWLYSYHDAAVHTKHRYTMFEINELLKRNKFNLLQSTYANMFLFPLSVIMRIISKIASHKKDSTSDVNPLHRLLNKLFYIPLWIESQLVRYISLPFGLSVVAVAQKPLSR